MALALLVPVGIAHGSEIPSRSSGNFDAPRGDTVVSPRISSCKPIPFIEAQLEAGSARTLRAYLPDGVRRKARTYLRAVRQVIRRATAPLRAQPDFLIVGAQKAGTTSLYAYLSQHPNIVPPSTKEIHFFDGGIVQGVDTFAQGESWYRAHFPLKARLKRSQRTYEASPLYLFHPDATDRIRRLLPDVRIIILLRNPTDRAISHYFHSVRLGRESRSMETALLQPCDHDTTTPDTTTPDTTIAEGEAAWRRPGFIHRSYLERGKYEPQVRRYIEAFGRDRVLILRSEDLFKRTDDVLDRVFRFVGVDPDLANPDLNAKNVSSNRTSIDPALYARLDRYFEPYNRRLADLLGTDFTWPEARTRISRKAPQTRPCEASV